MCNENDLDLSLSSETFESLRDDFNTIMERTIGNMTMKGADEATITVKLGITFKKTNVNVMGSPREVTKPVFKHDISSVMQVKDKMSGQFAENMELVWDDDLQQFVLRPIIDGQTTMFDGEDDYEDLATDEECDACKIDYGKLPQGVQLLDPPAAYGNYLYDDPEDEAEPE